MRLLHALSAFLTVVLASETWEELVSSNPPVARREHTSVWDASGGRMLTFGGVFSRRRTVATNQLYSFDPNSRFWSELSATGNARENHVAAWDDSARTMYIHGGQGLAQYGDLERYVVGSGWGSLTGYSDTRRSASAVWNAADETIIVFGGHLSSGRSNLGWTSGCFEICNHSL